MALKWLTEKTTTEQLTENTYIVITQNETVEGVTRNVVRRVPYANFAAGLGADLAFDEESQMLYLVNKDGIRIGDGTTVQTGISGLQMYTEADEDTGTQYLVLEDAAGNELCRTEFNVSGGGSGTAYVCRLINGMSGTLLNFPSGQSVSLQYSYYERYGNEQTTANATAEIFYKTATTDYQSMRSDSIQQGSNSVDITNYLQEGANYIKLQVTGGESGVIKTLVFTINVVNIALTSSFDESRAYSSTISFMYRVTGNNISKTMHFLIDEGTADETEWTVDIGKANNVQLTENINLAPFGHGDHTLKCWFMTDNGARSPVLIYDIMFDAAQVTPIISSTFDVAQVDYGEMIQVQYYVFTHGSDYTSEVDLEIYTLDENDEPVYFSQQALANVVKEEVQTWNITEYPSEGTIYLKISAGSASKTFAVQVNENTGGRDLSGVSTRLIAAYSVSGRSNSDVNRNTMNAVYTDIDDTTTTIQGALTGFNWRSNGWLSDNGGYPVLRISGGAKAQLNLPFLASQWTDGAGHTIHLSGTPTGVGRTFEIIFATSGVTDENDEIATLWDETNQTGIKIFPSKAYLLSSSRAVETDEYGNVTNKSVIPFVNFSSASKVRLSFVIEEIGHYVERIEDPDTHIVTTENKQLIRIYVNGELAKVISYSTDSFDSTAAKPILSAKGCIMDVYAMRFYDTALTDAEVLKNYIADLPSIAERILIYDKNDILDGNGDISLDEARKQYPCMVLTGHLSEYKGDKVKIGVLLYKPGGNELDEEPEEYTTVWEFMETDGDGKYGNVNNVQGTSSQYYIKKNYKITFYRWDAASEKFKKVKVSIFEDRIPVNTICIKADYMSPDSANTGNANFWQSVCPEPTPPQALDDRIQTAVMGYPILVFQRDTAGEAPSFIGRYNLNNDKSNSEAFGLEDEDVTGNNTKCQKWEYKDNSLPICNFQSDQLRALARDEDQNLYEVWEDALESCYPDQGDLEDEGLRPNTDHLQFLYSWLVQWANFEDASTETGTGGTYNGNTYDTEYDLKRARFRREFPRHFNVNHACWYFIANEVSLLVDNFAKNLFMTCYDVTQEHVIDLDGNDVDLDTIVVNGVVDISRIDWENSTFAVWYTTLYDLDSCLGADNNGRDLFPYYAEMWDTFNNRQVVNGNPSRLWRMFYAAYYTEIAAMYRRFRDTDKTLSTTQYLKAMIDDLTAALPTVSLNEDERYKYIDAFEGGYYDVSANDGAGGWVYTATYLYLAKSTMQSYHRDFVTKRMTMLDGKYLSDAYRNDNFNFRINRTGNTQPEDITFDVSPCQAMYLYTEWGNSGTYRGGKCLESESVPMSPANAGNWYNIVVACYGASHVKSFGDLSPLYPDLLQNLRGCVNLTELILGSGAAGYQNTALDSLADVGTLKMLQKLDIRNCAALSGAIDLYACDLIEEVYAEGSAITSLVLPEGGYMKKLHLPGSITNLEILDHSGLSEFQMTSYDSLLRIRVENTPGVDTAAILAARGTNLARIRLVGVNWNLTSEAALRALADSSMSSKAIDANGNNVNNNYTYPTVTGTCQINRIQKSLWERLHTLYPDLTITATTMYHVVKFYNGSVLHDTQEVNDGTAADAPTTPTKAATVQYVYSFAGWDVSYANITADTTIHATFGSSIQHYPIAFWPGTPEDPGEEELAVITENGGVTYGGDYTYPDDMPTKSGYVFCGWMDEDGHTYDYITQTPDASAKIDANGVPQTVNLYPVWSKVEMPAISKAFAALTPGEMLYAAIAIQNGGATGITVTYYAESGTYILYDASTQASVSIALADTRQWTLYNGETLTQQVLDFNHDYSDLAETHTLGITYAMKDLLTATGNMNPSYKHAFNYRFGDEDPIVSDDNDHSNENDPLLTNVHTATADEVTAGYVDITAEGPTFLRYIKVTHSDDSTDTWWFDQRGFWGGTDAETFTRDGAGAAVTTCSWYRSDLINDPDNREYKIGKMLSSLGIEPVNVSGSMGLYGWASTNYQWADFINDQATFTNFGGIKFDTTGNDSMNTAAGNPFNGTGKSRIGYRKCWEYTWACLTEMSEGAVISVPVVAGDKVEVMCYGSSRNWGGWHGTRMQRWANGTFLEQLPIGLRNIIVPCCKKSSWGNRSYAIRKGLYTMWLLGQAECGFQTTTHPYSDCGSKYPIFTDNASRIKKLQDGAGSATSWWERDPHFGNPTTFCNTYYTGSYYGTSYAHNSGGVCLGFTSGEAVS